MRYFSMFSGIGGFELAIEQAYDFQNLSHAKKQQYEAKGATSAGGLDAIEPPGLGYPVCVGYSEIDKYAIQIYQSHFPTHKNYGDITKIIADGLPDFDLLVGGFPCQSFSIAGKRKGFSDTRGTLFFDIARILGKKRPRYFILENVKGLLSHDNGWTFKTIIATLDELGYDLQWQVLNSKDFGVPQNRERVFIVGHLRGTPRPQVFPIGKTNGTTQEGFKQKNTQSEIASTLRSRYGNGTGSHIAPCIRATQYKSGDNQTAIAEDGMKIRRLTPTECERLQGFPDGWTDGLSDTQRYKCLGNAVTVNTVQAIINNLITPARLG